MLLFLIIYDIYNQMFNFNLKYNDILLRTCRIIKYVIDCSTNFIVYLLSLFILQLSILIQNFIQANIYYIIFINFYTVFTVLIRFTGLIRY